jgi:rSAM/selenodomain-associated transferase 2
LTPRYSFIIPVLNESQGIARQLRYLRRFDPAAELIVVDGGSEDDTVEQASALCDVLISSEPGRATQMNRGAARASGDYLCFLHADTVPQFTRQQWQLALSGRPGWGFCRVRLSGASPALRVIEWSMNLRSGLTGIGTGDQMQFVSKDLFSKVGGFADLPLMEDIALSKALRRQGKATVLRETVLTSSRRWEEHGIIRTVVTMWALRLAWFMGVPANKLSEVYYGRQA